jgi:hypothetical protein
VRTEVCVRPYNMSYPILLTMLGLSEYPTELLTLLRTHATNLCSGIDAPFYKDFHAYTMNLYKAPLPAEITAAYPHLRTWADFAQRHSDLPRDYWGHLRHSILQINKTVQAMAHCLDRVKRGMPCIRCSNETCEFQEVEERKIRFIKCGSCSKSWAQVYC